MSATRAPRVVLIGPPGSGKTSVADALGHLLDLPVRDTDADIEHTTGRSISDIFVIDGEPAFRDLEEEAVRAALAEHSGILAVGGGAPMNPRVAELLDGVPVVFLDVTLAHAMKRVGLSVARPLLIGSPRAQWSQLMSARRPTYERLATWRIDTDERTPGEVAEQIATLLASGNSTKEREE